VDDITAVMLILLEGNPKDKSWPAATKLMNNVDKFLDRLRGFKAVIDQGQVGHLATVYVLAASTGDWPSQGICHPPPPHTHTLAWPQVAKKTVEACRTYLDLPHFNKEVIFTKSRAAAGLCEWAINIVKYYDVVSEVEPKRQELAAANAKLHEANTLLAAVQQKVGWDADGLAGAAAGLTELCFVHRGLPRCL
jgi:dynein heavy chain